MAFKLSQRLWPFDLDQMSGVPACGCAGQTHLPYWVEAAMQCCQRSPSISEHVFPCLQMCRASTADSLGGSSNLALRTQPVPIFSATSSTTIRNGGALGMMRSPAHSRRRGTSPMPRWATGSSMERGGGS